MTTPYIHNARGLNLSFNYKTAIPEPCVTYYKYFTFSMLHSSILDFCKISNFK